MRAGTCLPWLTLSAMPKRAPGMEPVPHMYLRDEGKTTKRGWNLVHRTFFSHGANTPWQILWHILVLRRRGLGKALSPHLGRPGQPPCSKYKRGCQLNWREVFPDFLAAILVQFDHWVLTGVKYFLSLSPGARCALTSFHKPGCLTVTLKNF